MANMPQNLADQVLNLLKHANATAAPTTLYLALVKTAPALNAAGTECTGGTYGRASMTAGTAWSAISTVNGRRQISNSGDIVFTTATADWATDAAPVVGWEILDNSSGGNRYAFGLFDDPFPVLNGQTAKVLSGALVIAVS
jgi:hypothetical protein